MSRVGKDSPDDEADGVLGRVMERTLARSARAASARSACRLARRSAAAAPRHRRCFLGLFLVFGELVGAYRFSRKRDSR